MPASVVAAMVSLGAGALVLMVLIGFAPEMRLSGPGAWWAPLFLLFASAFLIVGLTRRSRVAWLLGRSLGGMGTLGLIFLIGLLSFSDKPVVTPAMPLASVLGLLAAFTLLAAHLALLGLPSARAHFDLVCPGCGGSKSQPVDFLFRKARCRRCAREW